MRKFYKTAGIACLGLLLSTQNSNAQTVSDFESQTLTTNSYWDGDDMSGTHNSGKFYSSFTDGTAIYPNVYDTAFGLQFGSWAQGFAFSNITDSVTSGFGNQHAAKAAIGVNNSNNYGVAIQDNFNGVFPTIQLNGTAANNTVSGLYITNTTFAANSMRDGDFAGKVFGSPNDANGNPDGTNGEDWFLLSIKGYTGGSLTTDSVNFYLADYRFANNAQDYIVTNWNWVDLTSLGTIDSVVFTLTSSDVGNFGMNTPAYFAFDNFNDQTVGITTKVENNKISIYPNPTAQYLNVNLTTFTIQLNIINVNGKVVLSENNLHSGVHKFDLAQLSQGIFLVQFISEKGRITTQRIIKN